MPIPVGGSTTGDLITVTDLPASLQGAELVDTMVAGVNAKAARVAPCLTWDGTVTDQPAPTVSQLSEAKLVLIGAVKRWIEAGAGSVQTETMGPFGMTVDTRQKSSGFNLWPSEIKALQDICLNGKSTSSGAFSITPSGGSSLAGHAPFCDLFFGGTTCSCGYTLTGGLYPLYEG